MLDTDRTKDSDTVRTNILMIPKVNVCLWTSNTCNHKENKTMKELETVSRIHTQHHHRNNGVPKHQVNRRL